MTRMPIGKEGAWLSGTLLPSWSHWPGMSCETLRALPPMHCHDKARSGSEIRGLLGQVCLLRAVTETTYPCLPSPSWEGGGWGTLDPVSLAWKVLNMVLRGAP